MERESRERESREGGWRSGRHQEQTLHLFKTRGKETEGYSVLGCACVCATCVRTCACMYVHVLTPVHVWYSDDGHRFADQPSSSTSCHQPETAMSSSLRPPSLLPLLPRSPHLILSHAPPTPHPTPHHQLLHLCPLCSPSLALLPARPPVQQRATSSPPSVS